MKIQTTAEIELSKEHVTTFIQNCHDPFALLWFLKVTAQQLSPEQIDSVRSFIGKEEDSDGAKAISNELYRVAFSLCPKTTNEAIVAWNKTQEASKEKQ